MNTFAPKSYAEIVKASLEPVYRNSFDKAKQSFLCIPNKRRVSPLIIYETSVPLFSNTAGTSSTPSSPLPELSPTLTDVTVSAPKPPLSTPPSSPDNLVQSLPPSSAFPSLSYAIFAKQSNALTHANIGYHNYAQQRVASRAVAQSRDRVVTYQAALPRVPMNEAWLVLHVISNSMDGIVVLPEKAIATLIGASTFMYQPADMHALASTI
ncbi:hypothetical protein CYLTODRAFT_446775, partial [Cylindrobasidium torrendii FP15055 ss-10]